MRFLDKLGAVVEAIIRFVFLAVPLVIGFIGTLAILGFQAYIFLQDGIWPEMSVMTALRLFDVPWAIFPQEWLGIHKILTHVPLSLSALLIGAAPAFYTWVYEK